jgi:F0F1-type ATP synthase membrane subunit b/b'
MDKATNRLLMEKILHRLETDSKNTHTASTQELRATTTKFIDRVRQQKAAFAVSQHASKVASKG